MTETHGPNWVTLQTMDTEILMFAANDLFALDNETAIAFRREMASRGLDRSGRWVTHEKAFQIWEVSR